MEISPYREAIERQREKQEDPIKLGMLRKRKAIVEHIFGEIKQAMGFRRFTVNGLEGVRAQWSLLCAVLNLKKMYRWWIEGNMALETRTKLPSPCSQPANAIDIGRNSNGPSSLMSNYQPEPNL